MLAASVAVVAVLALAAPVSRAGNEHQKPDELEEWRQNWSALFWIFNGAKFTIHDVAAGHLNRLSPSQAKERMERLVALLETSKTVAKGVPVGQKSEVRFWAETARAVSSGQCVLTNASEAQKRYNKIVAKHSRHASCPNLLVYLNQLKAELLAHCVKAQKSTLVQPIQKLLPTADRDLIDVLGTEQSPPEVVARDVADYLIQFCIGPVLSRAQARDETNKAYKLKLEQPCKQVRAVPEHIKQIAWYFRDEGALDLVDPLVEEFIRIEKICTELPGKLSEVASLMPNAKKRYDAYLERCPKSMPSCVPFFHRLKRSNRQ